MNEYIRLADIMKFPTRRPHYDNENADQQFVKGIESAMEYIAELPKIHMVECGKCVFWDTTRYNQYVPILCRCQMWKADTAYYESCYRGEEHIFYDGLGIDWGNNDKTD
jgi:hypothetical protein